MKIFRMWAGRGGLANRKQGAIVVLLALAAGSSNGCFESARPAAPEKPPVAAAAPAPAAPAPAALSPAQEAELLEDLSRRSFLYFYETVNRQNGLVPDRAPSPSFSSIAAVGFALAAWGIGSERGYLPRQEAAALTLATLRFFDRAPQGPAATGTSGHQGFYYHFLDMETGLRFEQVELSTIDTTLLLGGALFAQGYFDGENSEEAEIRDLAEKLYRRVQWDAMLVRPPLVSMGFKPETGYLEYDWHGLNEAMLLYLLAFGSPTHPIDPAAWPKYFENAHWANYYGYEHWNFAPLFGHQYSHAFVDFRGIRDEQGRQRGIDYFENSRRATLSQQAYAIDNPHGFVGYSAELWGLSACDGPVDAEIEFKGRPQRFFSYAARGAAATEVRDDGTLAPSALMGSMPFAPELILPSLYTMREKFGAPLYGRWGFFDAFNLSLEQSAQPDIRLQHGQRIPGVGWFDTDVLGIDQGISLLMIENHRSGLIWKVLRRNPHLRRGLERAGFQGGWLAENAGEAPAQP